MNCTELSAELTHLKIPDLRLLRRLYQTLSDPTGVIPVKIAKRIEAVGWPRVTAISCMRDIADTLNCGIFYGGMIYPIETLRLGLLEEAVIENLGGLPAGYSRNHVSDRRAGLALTTPPARERRLSRILRHLTTAPSCELERDVRWNMGLDNSRVRGGVRRQSTELQGQQYLPGFEDPMANHGSAVPAPPPSMPDREPGHHPSPLKGKSAVPGTPAQIVTSAVIAALDALGSLDAVLGNVPPLRLDDDEAFGQAVDRLLQHPARDLEARLVAWWISPARRASRSTDAVRSENADRRDEEGA